MRSELLPPNDPLEVYISRGLEMLADLTGDPSIGELDPLSPMSFSRISVAVQQLQVENYMAAAKEARKSFSPLGSDGRPMRKWVGRLLFWRVVLTNWPRLLRRYSERKHDHWFQGDRCWMSYVGK